MTIWNKDNLLSPGVKVIQEVGAFEDRDPAPLWQGEVPKFFVSNTLSKVDINIDLEDLILNWDIPSEEALESFLKERVDGLLNRFNGEPINSQTLYLIELEVDKMLRLAIDRGLLRKGYG